MSGAGDGEKPAAAALGVAPGSRLIAVGDRAVSDLDDARAALRELTAEAWSSGAPSTTVSIGLLAPGAAESEGRVVPWSLTREDLRRLHGLSWTAATGVELFQPAEIVLRADQPVEALGMGIAETHRWVLRTYVTFARLFQGTVKVEHLKGPIGIAHLGTRVAERGMIWLLFFMAMISINLAVINFLPLPIVDGGQFLFLVVEQVRGRPVPIGFQNAVTLAGLVLIASLFIFITYNDIVGIFSGP
jgi:regulator of sigma E protease